MARSLEASLYQALLATEFSFLSRGRRTIEEIYNAVEKRYPALCDNGYYCSECCRSGNNQPEWKHTVRNAMQYLKNRSGGPISFTGQRGYWLFE